MRKFENPGRSVMMARNGMAATSHPLSTLAAVNELQRGGNALDAAIAASAVQCVVEPASTGIGGDCFVLLSLPDSDRVIAYNGSGRAPEAATLDWYRSEGLTSIPRQSPHSVTVPGAIDAWCTLLRDYGTKSLGELFKPAIDYAEQGYAISPRVAHDWADQETLLRNDPDTAHIFLPDGKLPQNGSIHSQPLLARTLALIGENGPDEFYKGTIAQDMVEHLQKLGGLHTARDFAEARGSYETPVKTHFRGHVVHECPPAGQGVIALLILNILSGFEGKGDPMSADRLHVEIEATRLAYSIRDAVLADPTHSKVPVEWLLSQELAAELRAKIDPSRAMRNLPAFVPPKHPDTVYLCVVDKNRMAVSFINSIYSPFGSGLVTPKAGVLLQNRGQGFVLDPGHPNTIAPRKRPVHTIIPGMLTKGGKTIMPFGVMGGHYQAMGHAHFLSKVLDYGLDVQEAIQLPRVFPKPGIDEVEVEATVPAQVQEELRRRGHNLVPASWPIGGAQAIKIDWANGGLVGGSDHRKDGIALGY